MTGLFFYGWTEDVDPGTHADISDNIVITSLMWSQHFVTQLSKWFKTFSHQFKTKIISCTVAKIHSLTHQFDYSCKFSNTFSETTSSHMSGCVSKQCLINHEHSWICLEILSPPAACSQLCLNKVKLSHLSSTACGVGGDFL